MDINVTITEREIISVEFTESTTTRNASWGNISGDIEDQQDLVDYVATHGGGGGTVSWGTITGTLANQTDLQNALNAKASTASLAAHTSDTNNPHAVTKAQVGLANADNTSDANKPISTATQTALDLKQDTSTLAATIRATVLTGLSLLTGTAIDATDSILVAFGKLQKQITDNLSTLTSHTSNTSNPHSVTKTQVGLGNVPNVDATTTANITDSTNKRFITDAQQTVLGNTSGTNTGDQSSVTGNAGTATALQTARNIDGQSFNGTADITVIAPGTNAASSKATPVDADQLPLVDSAASNVLKKLTWANLKATLKTYFDTLYAAIVHTHTTSDITDFTTATNALINAKKSYYILNFESANEATPTDAATVFWGLAGISTGTAAQMARTVPISGRVVAAVQNWWGATAGSNETIQGILRHNDTTDYSIQDVGNTNSVKVFQNLAMNFNVAAGDVLVMKNIYPTWGTNPANVRRGGYVVIEAPIV